MKKLLIFLLLTNSAAAIRAQTFSLPQALAQALQHSPFLKSSALDVERHTALKRAAPEIPKSDVQLIYGQYNSIEKHDNNLTITQTLPFPTTIARQVQHAQALYTAAEYRYEMTRQELLYEVKRTFYELLYLKKRIKLLQTQDSLLQVLTAATAQRYKVGDVTLLEKTSAETQRGDARNQVQQAEKDYQITLYRLATLLNTPVTEITGELYELSPVITDTIQLRQNPMLQHSRQQIEVAHRWKKLQQSAMLPDIRIGYFSQTLMGPQTVNGVETIFGAGKRFKGFQVGLAVPLWFFNRTASVDAARLSAHMAVQEATQTQLQLTGRWHQAVGEMQKAQNNLAYFKNQALPNVQLLVNQNMRSYQTGEITLTTFLINAQQALRIQEAHLQAINAWNQSIISYEFITGTINEN